MKTKIYYFMSFLVFAPTILLANTTFYISPTGSDSNNGLTEGAPVQTVKKICNIVQPGDVGVFLDGQYSTTTTGVFTYNDANSSTPVNGTSVSNMTWMRAKNPGSVQFVYSAGGTDGVLFLGRGNGGGRYKQQFTRFEGFRFNGYSTLYNTDHIYLKACQFYNRVNQADGLSIGTNDGNWGNTFNLVEDCWVDANSRAVISNYRSSYNVYRRVIARRNGCTGGDCAVNPNLGMTVYNSSHVVLIHVMFFDGTLLQANQSYADFASAQHANGAACGSEPCDQGAGEMNGYNEWQGCASINSPDSGFLFENDDVQANTDTIKALNLVVFKSSNSGIDIGNNGNMSSTTIANCTVIFSSGGSDNFRILHNGNGSIKNTVAYRGTRNSYTSDFGITYANYFGADDGAFFSGKQTCSVGCLTTDPLANGAVKYPFRIESGSNLDGTAPNGQSYGANVTKKLGIDGTFYGDPSFTAPQTDDLWPWPNQARMKTEMCEGRTTQWCGTSDTLTTYLWNKLGNGSPYETVASASVPSKYSPGLRIGKD